MEEDLVAVEKLHIHHNPFEQKIPDFVDCDDEENKNSSILTLDKWDERLVSPFQNWLIDEIMSHAASSINVLNGRGCPAATSPIGSSPRWTIASGAAFSNRISRLLGPSGVEPGSRSGGSNSLGPQGARTWSAGTKRTTRRSLGSTADPLSQANHIQCLIGSALAIDAIDLQVPTNHTANL